MSHEKGISPLLSTVLIVSIAVILASMLMSWSSTITKSQQKDVSNKTGEMLSCTAANADIKDVYLDFTNASVNVSRVYVQNTGMTDLSIRSAQVISNKGEAASLMTNNQTLLPMLLPRGERRLLVFNISGIIPSCANFSKAAVSTNCPFPVEYDSAPKCVTG